MAAMTYPGYPAPLPLSRYEQLAPFCNAALRQANCTTVERVAMFLAQIGAESGSLRWTEELADGSAYNWRSDLGNDQAGDGPRFKGRSFIQITGRAHYRNLSVWAKGKGYVPTASYFVDHPPALAQDAYAFLGPVWYWVVARPGLNALADKRDIQGGTYAVNGGYNNLQGRTARWNKCLSLGKAILPGTGPAPTPEDDMPTQLYLSASAKKQNKVPAGGKWQAVYWDGWNPKGCSGGVSAILGGARLFSLTAWLYTTGLTPDDNLFLKIQTLTRDNKPLATFPTAELRGTTGGSALSYSQVGSVNPNSNLRILVSGTRECTITNAWWRIFTW
jgi:predicted chitinase